MPRLLMIAGLLAALGAVGCTARTPTPGGASGSKPEAARKQAESLALNAVNSAAEAQVRANPALARRQGLQGVPGVQGVGGLIDRTIVIAANQNASARTATPVQLGPLSVSVSGTQELSPKSPPRPGLSPIIINERVVSSLAHPSDVEAHKDAVSVACDLIQQRLGELDPPVRYRPTPNELQNEFLRRDSRVVRPLSQDEKDFFASKGITGNLVRVEFDVEVSSSQIRELRTRDRVSGTIRVFGALAAISLAGFLFLRADERTKGYLTRWLAIGAVLLATGVAAALYFV